jgi:hypothetical protein
LLWIEIPNDSIFLSNKCAKFKSMPISRRQFLAATAAPAFLPAATTSRPNFIVIVADDLGCHDLGCLGATDLKTPNIDALAASPLSAGIQCPCLRRPDPLSRVADSRSAPVFPTTDRP